MREGLFFVFIRITLCSNNFFLVHLIIRRGSLACSPRVFADIFMIYETPIPKLSILSVCECVPVCLLPMSYCFLSIFFFRKGSNSCFVALSILGSNFWKVKVRKNCKKIETKEKSEAWLSVDIFAKLILSDNLVLGSWVLNYRAAIIILTIG